MEDRGKRTWQPHDGEVRPALGEAGALADAGLPEAREDVDGGDGVVHQVLGGPGVHCGRHDHPRHADQAQDEAHHLAQSGRHPALSGLSLGVELDKNT